MLYRLICPVLGFLKRIPHLLPLSLLAIFLIIFLPLVYAKIWQHLDNDPDRGAIGIADSAYNESYATPRYLDQGWSPNDSLWFYNTSQGSGLMPYDLFMALKQRDSNDWFGAAPVPKTIMPARMAGSASSMIMTLIHMRIGLTRRTRA
jgi:hypothetical protein